MSGLLRSFRGDFQQLVEKQPDRPALILAARDQIISYGRLDQLMTRCEVLLEQLGLRPGDTVVTLLPNSAECLVLFFAALLGGYGFAPLPVAFSEREIEHWLNLLQPKAAVIADSTPSNIRLLFERHVSTITIPLDAEFTWLPEQTASQVTRAAGRIYLTTSGTTGDPRALVIDGDRLWSSGRAFLAHHHFTDNTLRFWNYLPMSYLGGLYNLALIPLAYGGSVVVSEPFSGLTFLNFWQTVERFEINTLWFVPTIVRGLISIARRARRQDTVLFGKRIRACFLGTAPIDLDTKREFETMFGLHALENFALSETTFYTSETLDRLDNRCPHSVGEVLPYTDVKLVPYASENDEGPQALELYVRSPFLFLGYLTATGRIELPLDDEGYFATGDLGRLNEENTLIIEGRRRDVIKRGGLFVALREIEVVAEQHPDVAEAVAVRRPHEFYGEAYDIYLRPKPEAAPHLSDRFSAWLHDNLARYKWPERVMLVDDFPRTATGKIRKHLLSA